MEGGQAAGQAGVLHAHLDGDGTTLGLRQAEHSAHKMAQGQATDVVEHDDKDDGETSSQELRGIGGDDDGHDEGYSHGGEGGQVVGDPTGEQGPPPLHHQADDNGHDDHPQDAEHHAGDVDIDALAGQQPREQGREQGRQQGGDARHAYGQGQVATGQVGDDVGGGATRAAAHEHHAQGQRLVEREEARQQPGQQGHDGELGQAAGDDVTRPAEHDAEVAGVEGEPHAKHDHAQQVVDGRGGDGPERSGEDQRQQGAEEHQQAHIVGQVAAECLQQWFYL